MWVANYWPANVWMIDYWPDGIPATSTPTVVDMVAEVVTPAVTTGDAGSSLDRRRDVVFAALKAEGVFDDSPRP